MQNEAKPSSVAAMVGGTIVSIILSVIVLVIVSTVSGTIFGLIQYYMSSMRIEAAQFFGVIFGSWVGIYAARAACDAVVKSYNRQAIFWILTLLCLVIAGGEFYVGLSWRSLTAFAQAATISLTAWLYFHQEEEI